MTRKYRTIAASLAAVTALTPLGTAFAQAPQPSPSPKKLNFIQKHPTLTSIGVAIGTHAALKHSAAVKKAHGQKLNFAERHPTITGIGAAIATHTVIKKTTPKNHQ